MKVCPGISPAAEPNLPPDGDLLIVSPRLKIGSPRDVSTASVHPVFKHSEATLLSSGVNSNV